MIVSKGLSLPVAAKMTDMKSRDNFSPQSIGSDFIEIEGFKIPD
jgi:hypothetical protein